MNNYTKEEIEKKVEDIWDAPAGEWWTEPDDIDVSVRDDAVEIKLSSMYESPALNLPLLMKLADYFGTKNINDDDRFSEGGCETCDYGSSYGFTLTVRPEPPKQ